MRKNVARLEFLDDLLIKVEILGAAFDQELVKHALDFGGRFAGAFTHNFLDVHTISRSVFGRSFFFFDGAFGIIH